MAVRDESAKTQLPALGVDDPGQPAGMVEFTLAFEPDDVPAGDRLHLATTISVTRLRPEGPELVQSQRVRLVGSRDTEVILATPDGGDVLLVVRVRPRARDEDGAVLELGIESAGPDGAGATVRETWVELSWDDVVRIAGFRAQADELLIEIKPER